MRLLRTSFVLLLGLSLLGVLAMACGDDDDEPLTFTVRVEVLEADAPVSVEATELREAGDDEVQHFVRVTWEGDAPQRLDDARFTHHVTEAHGHLLTAGRGCGVSWDDETNAPLTACTQDLRLIVLQPGETHDYPITLYRSVGRLEAGAGTYVMDEVIAWWPEDDMLTPGTEPEGRFTIRLTYELRAE